MKLINNIRLKNIIIQQNVNYSFVTPMSCIQYQSIGADVLGRGVYGQ